MWFGVKQLLTAPLFLLPSVLLSAMKNQHHFSTAAEEERALIYNFSPVYRGADAIFVQNYYFD